MGRANGRVCLWAGVKDDKEEWQDSWPQTLARLYGVALLLQRDVQAVFSVAGEFCLGKLVKKWLCDEDR